MSFVVISLCVITALFRSIKSNSVYSINFNDGVIIDNCKKQKTIRLVFSTLFVHFIDPFITKSFLFGDKKKKPPFQLIVFFKIIYSIKVP